MQLIKRFGIGIISTDTMMQQPERQLKIPLEDLKVLENIMLVFL